MPIGQTQQGRLFSQQPCDDGHTAGSSGTTFPIPAHDKTYYPSEDYSKTILHALNQQRKSGDFCDLQIKLSSLKTVSAHKSVLVAASPYFMGMFTSSFKEATSESVDLSSLTENSDVLEQVIDSFYGLKFEVNSGNVGQVLNLASLLMIDALKELCCNVMVRLVSLHNVVDYMKLALDCNLDRLRDKLTPIISARFHDYLIFQDEILSYSIDNFMHVFNMVDLGNISRKSEFLNMVFQWFMLCESDTRAKAFISILDKVKTTVVDVDTYKDIEGNVNLITEHLADVNSDIKAETAGELKKSLKDVCAVHYGGVKEIGKENEQEKLFLNSEVPKHIKREAEIIKIKTSSKEYHIKEGLPQDVKDLPQEKGTIQADIKDSFLSEFSETMDTHGKLALEACKVMPMQDAVILLSGRLGVNNEDEINILTYIPQRRAWFNLGSMGAHPSQESNYLTSCRKPKQNSHSELYGPSGCNLNDGNSENLDKISYLSTNLMTSTELDDWTIDQVVSTMTWYERETIIKMIMRGSFTPEIREIMCNMDMDCRPVTKQERILQRLYMEHYRNRSGRERMHSLHRRTKMNTTPSLITDEKWKCVYLRHKLYFYNDKFCEMVFGYDIVSKIWRKTSFNVVSTAIRRHHMEKADGISLIVLNQTLYAVVRLVDLDLEPKLYFSARGSCTKEQHLEVLHKIFRFEENNEKWEMVLQSPSHYVTLQRDTMADLNQEVTEMMNLDEVVPMFCQVGMFKTSLFSEDGEQLLLVCYKADGLDSVIGKTVYSMNHACLIHMDSRHTDMANLCLYNFPPFLPDVMPLFDDGLVVFIDSSLQMVMCYDIKKNGPELHLSSLEKYSSMEQYANGLFEECDSEVTMCDGKRGWVLRGSPDHWSEMFEVNFKCDSLAKRGELFVTHHPPPPVNHFTMATVTRMDSNLMHHLALPTMYLNQ